MPNNGQGDGNPVGLPAEDEVRRANAKCRSCFCGPLCVHIWPLPMLAFQNSSLFSQIGATVLLTGADPGKAPWGRPPVRSLKF